MSGLRWRDAEYRDRRALQQFLCTPPAPRRRFGRAAPPPRRVWELEAQGGVRNLRPPAPPDQLMLIGEDERRRVGAVAHAMNDHGPELVFVRVLAVALHLRQMNRPDGERTVGDELIDELVDRLANRADAAGLPGVVLWGKVDARNAASVAMCARAGADTYRREGHLEEWTLRVDFT